MPQGVAQWLAGAAVVVQLAALVVGVPVCRRLRSPPLGAALVAAGLLMAARRILAATGARAGVEPPSLILHDAGALVVSTLLLASLLLAFRLTPTRESDAAEVEVDEPRLNVAATAREEERELLSYELHDGLSQFVLAVKMHLDTQQALADRDPERAEQELALARRRASEATTEVQRVISNLSLTAARGVALGDAVQRYLSKLAGTQGWRYKFENRLGDGRLDPSLETMVFRVVQEALTNAARHARTSRVRVSLATEEGTVVATVRDWGRGFDPEQARWNSRQFGLRSMCGRARLLGGRCEIESQPGRGAQIIFRVPFDGTENGVS